MRVAGSHDLPATPERVWAALADPHVLEATTPGCHGVQPGSPLRASADWRVAALHGTFDVWIEVRDADAPRSADLRVAARGEPGALESTVQAHLEERDHGTRLEWEADCAADGPLAAVGSSVLEAAVRRQVETVLDRLERHLAGPTPAAAPGRPQETPRPPVWGPFDDGPPPAGPPRLVLAAVAGALAALLVVWLAGRVRRRR